MTKVLLPYVTTIAELKAYKLRLNRLLTRKNDLLHKYAEPSGVRFDRESVSNGDGRSPQERYIDALYKEDLKGLTIDQEIELCKKEIENLQRDMNVYSTIYNQSADKIEKDLLEETMIKGKNITRAVQDVADKNFVSESTVWRAYRNKKRG